MFRTDSEMEVGLFGLGGDITRYEPRCVSSSAPVGTIRRSVARGMPGSGNSSSPLSNQCLIVKGLVARALTSLFFLKINNSTIMPMTPRGTRMPTTIVVVFGEDGFCTTVTPLGRGTVLSIGVEELVGVARAMLELVVEVMKVEGPAEPTKETAPPVEERTEMLFGTVTLGKYEVSYVDAFNIA